jgi:hypothetical protein
MTMNQPEKLFEAEVPLDESKLAANRPLVEAIRRAAAESGPVLTAEEFIAWLAQQH